MRQAIHIFLKDSRQFRVPIAISLAWTVLIAVTAVEPWLSGPQRGAWDDAQFLVQGYGLVILAGSWVLLIALAFHADALPGDRQFWITRPFSRASLLGSKCLFVLAYITVPTMVAQGLTATLNGVPFRHFIGGLLWEQVLVTVLVVLPAAALASATSALAPFVLSLPLAALLLFADQLAGNWNKLEWVRTTAALLVVTAFSTAVVLNQFYRRQTRGSRTVGLAGVLAVIVVLTTLPWNKAFALQTHTGVPHLVTLQALLTPLPKPNSPQRDSRIQLHFSLNGQSEDTLVKCESAEVAVQTPTGLNWRSNLIRFPEWPAMSAMADGCLVQLQLPDAITSELRPVHVTGALSITVFGPETVTKIPVDEGATVLPSGEVCAGRKFVKNVWSIEKRRVEPWPVSIVECRRAFLPVEASLAREDRKPSVENRLVSYGPFPAQFALHPMFVYQNEFNAIPETLGHTPQSSDAPDVVLAVSRRPIAHLHVNVDAPNVNLADFDFTK